MPVIEALLKRGDRSLQGLLRSLSLCELTGQDLDSLDLEHSSFINVNTAKDLLAARRLVAALSPNLPSGNDADLGAEACLSRT